MVFDIQEPFSIESGTFDALLSMNVLEHIYGFDNALLETSRVLKKGGVFFLPFNSYTIFMKAPMITLDTRV